MKKSLILPVLLACLAGSAKAEDKMLKIGDSIPEFKLPYATKDTMDLEGFGSGDLQGKKYLLAFYPADWSGGCTKEMCTFRDGFADLQKLNIEILAVSGDYVYSHNQWAKHHDLPFKLLADQTREFGQKMGVYMPDKGMLKRSVFVVGEDGKLEYLNYEYSVNDETDFNVLKEALGK